MVSPVLMHWRYCKFALRQWNVAPVCCDWSLAFFASICCINGTVDSNMEMLVSPAAGDALMFQTTLQRGYRPLIHHIVNKNIVWPLFWLSTRSLMKVRLTQMLLMFCTYTNWERPSAVIVVPLYRQRIITVIIIHLKIRCLSILSSGTPAFEF